MSNFDQATQAAEKNMRNVQDVAQDSWQQVESNVASSVANVREFHLKTLGMLRSHAEASFELAEELLSAHSPDQVMGAWKSFADREVDMINRHAGEFSAMSQTVAKEAAQASQAPPKRS